MNRSRTGSLMVAVLVAACTESPPAAPDVLTVPVFSTVSEVDQTHLSGSEEVPSNDSRAQGQAVFKLNEDGSELSYRLEVANIENVLQSHIHLGAPGVSGGIVAWLYPSAPPAHLIPGRTQGTLAEGVIRDANVINALAGQGLAGLMQQIRAGNAYVNVHTQQHPPGEIRGQID